MPAGKGKKGGKGKKAVAAATSPLADSVLQRLPPEVLGEIAFHLHGFQASDKFAGARAGRVFKMGELGLGYYVDTRKPALSDLLPLAATDDFADSRSQDVHGGDGLLVVVQAHVEGLDVLRVVHQHDGLSDQFLGAVPLVLGLQVDAP